jgi:hypothetical protein
MGARSLFVAAICCLLTLSASSLAAPIAYVEGADLSNPPTGSSLTTFTLDVGTNTVSGTVTASGDQDSFAFTVPAGMSVTAASLTMGDVSGPGNLIATKWTLRDSLLAGTGTQLGIIAVSDSPAFPATTTVPFNTAAAPVSLPLGPGDYGLTGSFTPGSGNGTAAYTFSFTVTPEPTGLALLASLTAPALLARRRRRGGSSGR